MNNGFIFLRNYHEFNCRTLSSHKQIFFLTYFPANYLIFFLISGTSEIDQLYKISSILGTPGRNDWSEGFSLANQMSFRFPTFSSTHLSNVLGTRSSARAVSFLYALLSWNPSWRSSAQEALRHSYFRINTQHVRNIIIN